MAELTIILLIVVACVAWVVWTVREHKQALEEALDVLDDPYDVERRHLEERKRVVDKARAAAANR
jgi:hypothetical protein